MTLRELRLRRFMTLKDLAERAGVGVSTITAIESGRELPAMRTARKLADALEVEPGEIDEARAAQERAIQRGKEAA